MRRPGPSEPPGRARAEASDTAKRYRFSDLAGSVLLLATLLVGHAWAQTNGEVRDGDDVQPTARDVHSREAAADDAPSVAEEAREAATVDRLYRQLTGMDRAGSQESPVPPLPAVPAADASGSPGH